MKPTDIQFSAQRSGGSGVHRICPNAWLLEPTRFSVPMSRRRHTCHSPYINDRQMRKTESIRNRAQLGQAFSAAKVRRRRLHSVPSLSCPQRCRGLTENCWLTRYLRVQMHAKTTKVQLLLLTPTPAWTVLQARHCFMPHTERLCLVRCLVQSCSIE